MLCLLQERLTYHLYDFIKQQARFSDRDVQWLDNAPYQVQEPEVPEAASPASAPSAAGRRGNGKGKGKGGKGSSKKRRRASVSSSSSGTEEESEEESGDDPSKPCKIGGVRVKFNDDHFLPHVGPQVDPVHKTWGKAELVHPRFDAKGRPFDAKAYKHDGWCAPQPQIPCPLHLLCVRGMLRQQHH